LKILIEKGIDVNLVDKKGCNALDWCSRYPEIVKIIKEKR